MVQASIRLEHTLLAVEREHEVHVMLELTTPPLPGDEQRQPLRLALVLDRSGSMAGSKLEVAKRCAAWLVGRLAPTDELALVDYDDRARLLVPLRPVAGKDALRALGEIEPGGSTNLSGGWLAGLEQLRGGGGKILLLSDGLANVGVTDRDWLAEVARNAARDRIGTSTIGFGADFDEDLLTAMADAGGGNAHFAETPDAAPGIFADEIDGLTRLAAQNVSVEIRPCAEVEVLGILNEYPQVVVDGGVRASLGDSYAGESRRVVFELQIPLLAELGLARVADVVVRYVSVGDEIVEHTVTVPVVANLVSADEAAAGEPDLEVREEALVLGAARARNEAIRLADEGSYEAARENLRAASALLRDSGLEDEAGVLESALPQLAPAAYDALARKNLRYQARGAQRQRRSR
jgi:Ca-activated chloride channel homolog